MQRLQGHRGSCLFPSPPPHGSTRLWEGLVLCTPAPLPQVTPRSRGCECPPRGRSPYEFQTSPSVTGFHPPPISENLNTGSGDKHLAPSLGVTPGAGSLSDFGLATSHGKASLSQVGEFWGHSDRLRWFEPHFKRQTSSHDPFPPSCFHATPGGVQERRCFSGTAFTPGLAALPTSWNPTEHPGAATLPTPYHLCSTMAVAASTPRHPMQGTGPPPHRNTPLRC